MWYPSPSPASTRNREGKSMLTFQTTDRDEWRACLEKHYKTEYAVWFVFPAENSDEKSLSYEEVAEEALCFGWSSDTGKVLDSTHRVRRFSRRPGDAPYSQSEINSLREMALHGKLMPEVHEAVENLVDVPFLPDQTADGRATNQNRTEPQGHQPIRSASEDRKRGESRCVESTRRRPDGSRRHIGDLLDGRLGRLLRLARG